MIRSQKVKDLVEVRDFASLTDFYSEPAETLGRFKFTEITSALMAEWLGKLSQVGSSGKTRRALAGYRGVGKSHFMAVFAAIAGNPELRASITDTHVRMFAESLFRRRYPVVCVRRGSSSSLVEEFREAVAEILGLVPADAPAEPDALLHLLSQECGDIPPVILVDTARGRASRVKRDDGPVLSELSIKAAERGIFIAVALDDDITEADGTNAVLVENFVIDYLDPEHLHKIVENHIFPKDPAGIADLEEVYKAFRSSYTEFRWSVQRFAALYPLHPLILEIAPVVRLYAQDFAPLSFASDAGRKILGRSALSLIGIDDVFDNVERMLRKCPELEEWFASFDEIVDKIPQLVPVSDRLAAKLVIKALFIMSLEGSGTSSPEIDAAVMLGGSGSQSGSSGASEEILDLLVLEFPQAISRESSKDEKPRYSFRAGGKDRLEEALSAVVEGLGGHELDSALGRICRERFPDWNSTGARGADGISGSEVEIDWRGSSRRVEIERIAVSDGLTHLPKTGIAVEYAIRIQGGNEEPSSPIDGGGIIHWKTGPLTDADRLSLLKFHAVVSDDQIRNSHPQHIAAAAHSLSVLGGKIWERVFLREARFTTNGHSIEIPEEALKASGLSEYLSNVVAAVLDQLFPEHPEFQGLMTAEVLSELVSDLYSGARTGQARAQELASKFAEPLGIAERKAGRVVPVDPQKLLSLKPAASVMMLFAETGGDTQPLSTVTKTLGAAPYGFGRETQFLLLSALVAAGKIEFLTEKGDRINARSLDLGIVWDAISGVALPRESLYSVERLAEWARIFTGDDSLRSIILQEDRVRTTESLNDWLRAWEALRILNRFEEVPSEELNTKAWGIFASVEKAYSQVADSVTDLSAGGSELEDCLQHIAASFSDSEEEFEEKSEDLGRLIAFTEGASLRNRVMAYLSTAENTGVPEIDQRRKVVGILLRQAMRDPSPKANEELQSAFDAYKRHFKEFFITSHEEVFAEDGPCREVREVMESDVWRQFELLSSISIFSGKRFEEASRKAATARLKGCAADLDPLLEARPFCDCSFRLSKLSTYRSAATELVEMALAAIDSFRRTLAAAEEIIAPALEEYAKEKDSASGRAAASLLVNLPDGLGSHEFSSEEMSVIQTICDRLEGGVVIPAEVPGMAGFVDAAELRDRLESWASELPQAPVMIDLK